jgi:hypothetical protein
MELKKNQQTTNAFTEAIGASAAKTIQSFMDSIPKISDLIHPVIPNDMHFTLPPRPNEVLEHINRKQLNEQEKHNLLIAQLISTIQQNDIENGKLGRKMMWLAVVGVILTATQIIPAIETLNHWFHWWE